MKDNRIKLILVLAMAIAFMLAFTCCVNTNISSENQDGKGRVTLFTPIETSEGESTTLDDPYSTSENPITMPPTGDPEVTTTSPSVDTDPIPPVDTEPEDTVYSGFSGLY